MERVASREPRHPSGPQEGGSRRRKSERCKPQRGESQRGEPQGGEPQGGEPQGGEFEGGEFEGANLIEANCNKAILSEAILSGASLNHANLSEADLSGSHLRVAKLWTANLSESKLTKANFREAYVRRANLTRANLEEANVREANLREANLAEANLRKASRWGADLNETNLIGANLREANLRRALLLRTDLMGADLTGCRIYGASAWDLILDGAKQQDLIITPEDEPAITADNIEVAQFVYLLLHNQKIRDVIDTITSKAVLILGRFTDDRKTVLDALREELRKRDYLPILFDFAVPATRDITETVTLLARIARFIIADLTDPSSIPKELEAIVPHVAVPVQPLLEGASRPYAMFTDYWKYDWVLPVYGYTRLEPLLAALGENVIAPAEAKVKALQERRRMIEVELIKPQ